MIEQILKTCLNRIKKQKTKKLKQGITSCQIWKCIDYRFWVYPLQYKNKALSRQNKAQCYTLLMLRVLPSFEAHQLFTAFSLVSQRVCMALFGLWLIYSLVVMTNVLTHFTFSHLIIFTNVIPLNIGRFAHVIVWFISLFNAMGQETCEYMPQSLKICLHVI